MGRGTPDVHADTSGGSMKMSPFGEMLVAQRSPTFELSSYDPLSILRDVETGDVTHDVDVYQIDGDGGVAVLESAERGRYLPGFAAEVGIGIRQVSRQLGGEAEWGGFDGTDGFRFRVDDDGLWAEVIRSGTVLSSTERAAWNVDRLDGAGMSGINIHADVDAFLRQGHIWQQRFTWYGFGQIEFQLVGASGNGRQMVWPLHRVKLDGSTSIREPNVPVRASADGAVIHVGGRQYSVIGRTGLSEVRVAADWRLDQSVAADGAFHPLLSIRRDNSLTWAKGVKITPDDVSIITDQPLLVQTFVAGEVSGGAWAAPANTAAGESAVEVNKTATSVDLSSAIAFDAVVVTGSKSRQGQVRTSLERPDLPRTLEAVVAARVIGGSAATVSSAKTWTESR